MKCPYCQSDRLRRSRHRPEDGLWRSMFYSAYRCRDCGQRAQQLSSGPLLSAAVVAVLSATFALGFMVNEVLDDEPPSPALPIARSVPSAVSAERDDADTSSTPAGEYALAGLAEESDPMAQLRFGLALINGNGVERNPAAGLKWIEKAAEQGYADAQFALGNLHLSGRGALQSFPLAFQWLERAAQQNHADAQYGLGLMYRNGQGVAIDKPKAYIWFNLAAAQGHERARDARDGILPSLTPEQAVAAQRAAHEWRPVVAGK